MSKDCYDLIIVGAGVVGCAAAKAFAEDGRKVLLLERDLSEPDRIVGELMQPGGIQALKELGMEECVEGIDAIACYGYGVYRQGQLVDIPYSTNPSTGKQHRGMAFHHGRFIQNLRKSAAGTAGVTVKEMTVSNLIENDNDKVTGVVAYKADVEEKFYAPLTLVADGIFSKFRKDFTTRKTKITSHFVGLLMHDLELPFPQKGFVVIAKPSPILMYQIAPHDLRVLVDVPGETLPQADELKQYMLQVVLPQLPPYMQDKFEKAIETERLRPMPSGFLPPTPNQRQGTLMLGDAFNIRSPLTGGGMTVALQDVLTVRELLSTQNVADFNETDLVVQATDALHWKRKSYSTSINVLAMSLYTLFAAQDKYLTVLQNGCFEYFKTQNLQGPVDLLSAVHPSPLLLVYHFFAVAVYSIFIMYKEGGLVNVPKNMYQSVIVLYTASVTILPYLWEEFKG
ncbi:hypothetical protein G6F37_002232 [Rhizopus arrhizus]|nr:hypothetical protein G6F38_002109 [Rhizopus arrhizus]KAG1162354.1 hypothetical protein G6F37_002232 [Rhizopus arrhizus]